MTNVQLRQYNAALKKNMRFLISCSTENEKTQQKMDEMEEAIFDSPDMKSMFDTVAAKGKRVFEMDVITITVEEALREHYPSDYKQEGGSAYINSGSIFFAGETDMGRHFTDPSEPALKGNLEAGNSAFFPGILSRKVKSEALLPVTCNGRVAAVVAFGSKNPSRFMEEFGGRFLKRMGRTLALKVE